MSVSVEQTRADTSLRLFTAADLAAMPSELPSGSIDFELDNGRFIVVSPPGNRHAQIQLTIGSALKVQGADQGHGKAYVEVGVVLWRGPDRVVGVDVAFIAATSLPERESPEGYLETIPDLMVEIRSKNDSLPYLQRKMQDYLTAGVKIAWLIDDRQKQATIYRQNEQPTVLDGQQTLTLNELIPGFSLPLADLFKT
jgi:Uma2 family endonuclease